MGRPRLQDQEKLNRVEYAEKHGMEAMGIKYNLTKPLDTFYSYKCYLRRAGLIAPRNKIISANRKKVAEYSKNHSIMETSIKFGIASCVVDVIKAQFNCTTKLRRKNIPDNIKKEILDFYNTNGSAKTLERYSAYFESRQDLSSTLSFYRRKFKVPVKARKDTIRSDGEKLEIIEFYIANGGRAAALRYGYKTSTSASSAINRMASSIGYPKPLKWETTKTVLSDADKLEMVNYYIVHGITETCKKFKSGATVYIYAAELGIDLDKKEPFISDEDKLEMAKYLLSHTAKEFEYKFGTRCDNIQKFIRERGLDKKNAL